MLLVGGGGVKVLKAALQGFWCQAVLSYTALSHCYLYFLHFIDTFTIVTLAAHELLYMTPQLTLNERLGVSYSDNAIQTV